MPDLQEVFRMATQKVDPDPGALERQHRFQRRTATRRKVGAFAVAATIAVAAIAVILATRPGGNATTPATQPSVTMPDVPEADYVIDLNTGAMTPLPEAILRSLGDLGKAGVVVPEYRYAASSDGSRLAYVGSGEGGSPQIFIAGIDGSGLRQMTHDPRGAVSPAWSPDGNSIAYLGYGGGDVQNLFALEVATGETTQITDESRNLSGPSFTPDGSSLVYTDPGKASDGAEMRTVPIAGGPSVILFGGGHGGMGHASQGSMSPDGSLVTMTGHEIAGPGAQLFVSNVDGTQRRAFPAYGTNPAGTWSPDGSQIVGLSYRGHRIIVVNIATGDASRVAEGRAAIWLDDHTLLVD